MRTPRRVPWASRAELNELYDFVFSPNAGVESKYRGLERMSLYISSPSCPAFIHILHSLVSADLLPAPRNVVEAQSTRLSCAMAIVRFINGMVDPLQTGPYARPISHLAATLQIPPSLISLRHRATHEDLPPLPLLRTSVIQCISYLHTYSLLPLLAESSTQSVRPNTDRALRLVSRYKRLTKERLKDRDVDEGSAKAKELRKIRRAMEVEDVDDLVEALCSTEGIIPVARRAQAAPPVATLQTWQPLLSHIAPSQPRLAATLAEHILGTLMEPTEPPRGPSLSSDQIKEEQKERIKYRWTLAVWLVWIWSGEASTATSAPEMLLAVEEKRELWAKLLPALLFGDPILRLLATRLAQADSTITNGWQDLESLLPVHEQEDLLSGLDDLDDPKTQDESLEKGLSEMEFRLKSLDRAMSARLMGATGVNGRVAESGVTGEVAPGWRRLTTREWKACPIGMSGLA